MALGDEMTECILTKVPSMIEDLHGPEGLEANIHIVPLRIHACCFFGRGFSSTAAPSGLLRAHHLSVNNGTWSELSKDFDAMGCQLPTL